MDPEIGRRITADKIRLLGNADCTMRLGQPGAWRSPPINLRGIFNRFHAQSSFNGDGLPVSVMVPTLFVALADFSNERIGQHGPRKGDLVQVRAPLDVGGWDIAQVKPDGIGGALLMLTSRDDDVSVLA